MTTTCATTNNTNITNNHEGGSEPTDTNENEHESRIEPAISDNNSMIDDRIIEEEFLDEMMNDINNTGEEFLNESELDDEHDFFDNDDQELMNKLDDIES